MRDDLTPEDGAMSVLSPSGLLTLVQRLRDLRKLLRLSQTDVATQLGWHQTELSQLETGERVSPSFEKLVKLGQVYGLSPNDLALIAGFWDGPEPVLDSPYWDLIERTIRDFPPGDQEEVLRQVYHFVRGKLAVQKLKSQ